MSKKSWNGVMYVSEFELAKRAIKREEQAFLEVIHHNKETLYRTAYAFLKNEHDSIEAVQEVTVRAYKKIHTVREPNYLTTWLVRITMNYCQDQLRKKKRYTSSEELHELGMDSDFTHLELEEALATLPECGTAIDSHDVFSKHENQRHSRN